MTPNDMDRCGITPAAFVLANSRIRIEVSGDLWSVCADGERLNVDNKWEPYTLDETFFARSRFTLDQAMRRAVEARARGEYSKK